MVCAVNSGADEEMSVDLQAWWQAVCGQDEAGMRALLHPGVQVRWPNTGEVFTAEQFIRVNCAYPGQWRGELLRQEQAGDTTVLVQRIQASDGSLSLHAVSFVRLQDGLVMDLEEYWSEDGLPPIWRQRMQLDQGSEG